MEPLSAPAHMAHLVSSLCSAAEEGLLDTIELVLSHRRTTRKGHLADMAGPEGQTPLIAAAKAGHVDVVEYLLQSGATPQLAVWDTCVSGKLEVLRRLCAHGAVIDCGYGGYHDASAGERRNEFINSNTFLTAACLHGHADIVSYLLAQLCGEALSSEDTATASISTTTAHNSIITTSSRSHSLLRSSPLEAAAQGGHLACVRVLIEQGNASPDAVVSGRQSPLYKAAEGGHLPVCRYLVDRAGAAVDGVIYRGRRTPLFGACLSNHVKVARYLVEEAGADPECGYTNNLGTRVSPLIAACEHNAPDALSFMVTKVSDVDAPSFNGETALYTACERGHTECVRILLREGRADPNKADAVFGMTPLYIAARSNHTEVVRLLLYQGRAHADLERENYRFSPFHIACSLGHLETAQMLASAGASLTRPTMVGSSPLQLAQHRNRDSVVQWLEAVISWTPIQIALDARLPHMAEHALRMTHCHPCVASAAGTPRLMQIAMERTVKYEGAPEDKCEETLAVARMALRPFGRKTHHLYGSEDRAGMWIFKLCAARSEQQRRRVIWWQNQPQWRGRQQKQQKQQQQQRPHIQMESTGDSDYSGRGQIGENTVMLPPELWRYVAGYLARGDLKHVVSSSRME